jgi:hypothetical protein
MAVSFHRANKPQGEGLFQGQPVAGLKQEVVAWFEKERVRICGHCGRKRKELFGKPASHKPGLREP